MGILDIFDKNLLEERKNHMEIPKEFITREFLNTFKDLNVRQQVYTRIVDTSLSYDECINLIKLYKENHLLAVYLLEKRVQITNDNIELAKLFNYEILNSNKDFSFFENNKNKLLQYKEKYTPNKMVSIINDFEMIDYLITGNYGISEEVIVSNINKIKVMKTSGIREADICSLLPNVISLSDADLVDLINLIMLIDKQHKIHNSYYFNKIEILNYLREHPNKENIKMFKEIFSSLSKDIIKLPVLFSKYKNIPQFSEFIKYLIIYVKPDNAKELIMYKLIGCEVSFTPYDKTIIHSINKMKEKPENLSPNLKKVVDIYTKLMNCKTTEDYCKLLEQIDSEHISISSEEFKQELNTFYNKNLENVILDPVNLEGLDNVEVRYEKQFCNEDGKEHVVKIIKLKDVPFTSLTSSIGPKDRSATLSNQQAIFTDELYLHPSLWNNANKSQSGYKGTDFISMSLNSDERFYIFNSKNKPVITGYSHLDNDQVRYTKGIDGGTNMKEGYKPEVDWEYHYPEELVNRALDEMTFRHEEHTAYNEVVSKREGVVPDYIMTATQSNNSGIPVTNSDTPRQWAAYYDIPIIEIDCESYYNSASERLNKYIYFLKSSSEVPSLDQIKRLRRMQQEAEQFSSKRMSFLDLLMTVIDMNNREWNRNNIDNLKVIFEHTFDKNNLTVGIYTAYLDLATDEKTVAEKLEKIKRLKERMNLEEIKLNVTENQQNFSM